jgi:polyene macrolide polyketide synthase
VFRAALDEVLGILERPTLLDDEQIHRTGNAQPALFALEYALYRLWSSWGVVPAAVMGHSLGEITAACVAGVFSLRDACALVTARGRLMDALPAGGAMVSIEASEASVVPFLTESVSLAAINGPAQVVISGPERDVLAIVDTLSGRGVRSKRLEVSHAFHSPLMEPMLAEFRRVVERIDFHPPRISLVSNVTGAVAGDEVCDPAYWVRHVREPVRFMDGIRALDGVTTYVEMGPHPVLSGMGAASLPEQAAGEVVFLPSLRRQRDDWETLLSALCAVHARGGEVDWVAFMAPLGGQRVPLPTYPFQRQRYWLPEPKRASAPAAVRVPGHPGRFPLTGHRQALPDGSYHHVIAIDLHAFPWLADHRVYDQVFVPGTFYVAALLAAGAEHWPRQPICLEQVHFIKALAISDAVDREHDPLQLHMLLTPLPDRDGFRVTLSTPVAEEGAGEAAPVTWRQHAEGIVRPWSQPAEAREPLDHVRARYGDLGSAQPIFDELAAIGVDWGPRWRWVRAYGKGPVEGSFLGWLQVPDGMSGDVAPLHPALVDNALGLFMGGWKPLEPDPVAWLPLSFERMVWYGGPVEQAFCEQVPAARADDAATGGASEIRKSHLALWDQGGRLLATIDGFIVKRAPKSAFLQADDYAARSLHEVSWQPIDSFATALNVPDATLVGTWLVLAAAPAEQNPASAVVAALRSAGVRVVQGTLGDDDTWSTGPLAGAIVLWDGRGQAGMPERVEALTSQALRQLQRWLDASAGPARLVWLTRRATAPNACEDLASAPLWGLARTFRAEHPRHPLLCIDLDIAEAASSLPATLVWALDAQEFEVALRAGSVLTPRLVRAAATHAEPRPLAREGTILITGGLGALGRQVAVHLAKRGAGHLLLVSRRGADTPHPSELVASLKALGARVTIAACNLADFEATRALLASVPAAYPLRGVIHTAGVLDDGILTEQTAERFARVLLPKVRGAWNLHLLTEKEKLDFFVLFSSAAGVLGTPGQSNYAAANVFLDALAQHRTARSLPAQSLAWGAWLGEGMAAQLSEADQRRLGRQGLLALPVDEGLAILDQAMSREDALLVPVRLELGALRRFWESAASPMPPLWRALVRAPSEQSAAGAASWVDRIRPLSAPERRELLLELVRSEVAKIMEMGATSDVPLGLPLTAVGLDSLMAIELRNRLAALTQILLPATLLLEYPTIEMLADYMLEQHQTSNARPSPSA